MVCTLLIHFVLEQARLQLQLVQLDDSSSSLLTLARISSARHILAAFGHSVRWLFFRGSGPLVPGDCSQR